MGAEGDNDDDAMPEGTIGLGHRLIANAMRYRTARAADTHEFRTWQHDRHLVPKITDQLRFLLESFHRDTNVTYDIQGLRDEGTDVLVRLQAGITRKFIGIQVKSHIEISEKGIAKDLRAQLSRSEDRYNPLLSWYIFLAGDVSGPTSRTQTNMRSIQAEFASKRHVFVIDAVYALTFLRLTKSQMASLVTLTLRTGDPLQEEARLDLQRHPVEAAIILYLVTRAVSASDPDVSFAELRDDSWISAIANVAPFSAYYPILDDWGEDDDLDTLPPDRLRQFLAPEPVAEVVGGRDSWDDDLAMHLDKMSEDISERDTLFRAPLFLHNALFALAAEGRVKHDLEGSRLIEYLVDVILG